MQPDGSIKNQTILGPLRVFPGWLSVSWTFGDVEAKLVKFGGNPNVVIAEPEIQMIKIDSSCDYIILAWINPKSAWAIAQISLAIFSLSL